MGCDIHAVFEKEVTSEGGIKQWEAIDSSYDGNRHYKLFGWLANVRNGYGFAGTPTGDAITPIVHPNRGFPKDFNAGVSGEDREYYNGSWMGEHSYNWLLASEILKARDTISSISTQRGVISLAAYRAWDKKSEPKCYSSWSSGRTIEPDNPLAKRKPSYGEHINAELQSQPSSNWKKRSGKVMAYQDPMRNTNGLVMGKFVDVPPLWGEKSERKEFAVINRSPTMRKSKLKHLRKLQRYAARCPRINVNVTWIDGPDQFRKSFAYFTDEIEKMYKTHGEFRMVMGFDS